MAYESAKIGGDDYTTYPLDENGKPIPVDMVENGKSFKFVQPAVAKERFVKQFAKNNNMTVQEVKETVFGDQPVGKKKFYITFKAVTYGGIFGSSNKAALEGITFGQGYSDNVEKIISCDDEGVGCLLAEKLNGLKLEDGTVCEYLGPKVTCLYCGHYGSSSYALYTYDGKSVKQIDSCDDIDGSEDEEIREQRQAAIDDIDNTYASMLRSGKDENKRIYKSTNTDLEALANEIDNLSGVETYSEAVEIIRTNGNI